MEYMSIVIGVIAAIAMVFVFSLFDSIGPGPSQRIAECYSKGGVVVKGVSARGRAAFGCYDIKDLEIK